MTDRENKILEAIKDGNVIKLENNKTYESAAKEIVTMAKEKGLSLMIDASASVNSTQNIIKIILK